MPRRAAYRIRPGARAGGGRDPARTRARRHHRPGHQAHLRGALPPGRPPVREPLLLHPRAVRLADEMTSNYRLRLPGPTTVPERIRLATAAPMQAHRGAEFKAMLGEVQTGLRAVYGTAQDVFLYAGSGTAMMEASLANVVAPGDAVLVAVAGH